MSLLRDALKKQEEEGGLHVARQPDPPPPPPPSTLRVSSASAPGAPEPPPPPTPSLNPSKTDDHKESHEWVAMLLVGFAVLIIVSGLIATYFLFFRAGDVPVVVEQEAPLSETEAQLATHTQVPSSPSTVPEPESPAPREPEVAAPIALTPEEIPVRPSVLPPPEPVPPRVETSVAPSAPAPTPRSVAAAPAASAPSEVFWPDIRLQAAMGTGRTGAVMIDGDIYEVGGLYQGVRVVEITSSGVLMQYGGQERVIRVRR